MILNEIPCFCDAHASRMEKKKKSERSPVKEGWSSFRADEK